MNERSILVLNAGSSSLKFSLFRAPGSTALTLVLRGQVDGPGSRVRLTVCDDVGRKLVEREVKTRRAGEPAAAFRLAGAWLREQFPGGRVVAVGHRIVHGGSQFSEPVRLDDRVCAELDRLVPLAPLHLPRNLAVIRAVQRWQPGVPQVACFDTAFHRAHPLVADVYALPWEYYQAGVRRYGFHGLSYEYIASRLRRVAPRLARGRVVVAHLGNGASLCAIHRGRSVDSTMGFSVLDGVPMGTRPGAVDPGVLLHLVAQGGLRARDLERLLYHRSGLLGLSGVSHDMRVLLDSAQPRARLAVDYFIHRIAREIGALTATLGGLDGLVFTAGIGEHSPVIRARIVQACAWLGLTLDPRANERGGPRISAGGSDVSAWVIPTDEELMIARHTLRCFRKRPSARLPPRLPTTLAEPDPRRRRSRATGRLGPNPRKEPRS